MVGSLPYVGSAAHIGGRSGLVHRSHGFSDRQDARQLQLSFEGSSAVAALADDGGRSERNSIELYVAPLTRDIEAFAALHCDSGSVGRDEELRHCA
jgi:hypothetical protein